MAKSHLIEFDVALSFAGEQRDYVEKVAEYLRSQDVNVFYDKFFENALWGKDLIAELPEIYSSKRSKAVVVFASAEYKTNMWARHEVKSAILSSLKTDSEFLLPARFEDIEIPGLSESIVWIDLSNKSPESFGKMIITKLTGTARPERDLNSRNGRKVSNATVIKRRLAMKKRVEKDFVEKPNGAYDARNRRERIIGNEIIVHDVNDTLYPESAPNRAQSNWFKIEIFDLYSGGLECIVSGSSGIIDANGNWTTIKNGAKFDESKFRLISVWAIGRIPYDCIVDYDMDTDDYYHGPHVYCRYWNNNSPWEGFRFVYTHDDEKLENASILISFQRMKLAISEPFFDSAKLLW
jgi:hypothetical protein